MQGVWLVHRRCLTDSVKQAAPRAQAHSVVHASLCAVGAHALLLVLPHACCLSAAVPVMRCREYPEMSEDTSSTSSSSGPKFKLALHCGGCMIDAQKMRARIADMEDAGVPVTNYGLFLSYVQSPQALRRVLEPWGVAF